MKRKTQEDKIKLKNNLKSKRFKAQKGITLIALVVTIVVLLILAGVSINLVLGDNGIINKSKEARDATRYGSIMDEYELYKADNFLGTEIGEGGSSFSDFLNVLKQKGLIDDDDIAQINSENKLTISDKYEISFSKSLYKALKDGDIQVGDYVTYAPSNTSATYSSAMSENGYADQTYSVDTSTQWRILGTQGEQVLLISADPIKKDMETVEPSELEEVSKLASLATTEKVEITIASAAPEATVENIYQDPYFYMKGAYSYVNCKKALNDICGIYSSNLGTARSITANDINNVLGVKVENNKVYFESDPDTNIDEGGNLGQTYTYTDTDYTPEGYIDGKKTVSQQSPRPTSVTQDAYYYDYTGLMTNTIGNTTVGELLFEQTLEDGNYAKSYWLASPAAFVFSVGAFFGPGVAVYGGVGPGNGGMFRSDGYWNAVRFAVRPVVVLNSGVTVDQVQKTTGSTTPWSYDNSNPDVENGSASNGEAGANVSGGNPK